MAKKEKPQEGDKSPESSAHRASARSGGQRRTRRTRSSSSDHQQKRASHARKTNADTSEHASEMAGSEHADTREHEDAFGTEEYSALGWMMYRTSYGLSYALVY